MKGKGVKIVATVILAAVGIGFLASRSGGDISLYRQVDEVMARPGELVGKNLQVHGYVVPGSLHEEIRDQRTLRSFRIAANGAVLEVRHAGAKPDSFKDQAAVAVKGRLAVVDGAPVFTALDGEAGILAKCPSKYSTGSR